MNWAAVTAAPEGKIGCDSSEGVKKDNDYDISTQSMVGVMRSLNEVFSGHYVERYE